MQTHMFLKQTKEWIIQPQLFSSSTARDCYASKHSEVNQNPVYHLAYFLENPATSTLANLSFDSLILFYHISNKCLLFRIS